MARRRSPVRKRGRSRSYSSDSRSYSRSRSPSTSEPSRGPLRQPPQLRGAGGTDEGRDPAATQQKAAMAQIAQSKARITALESELANAKKSSEELQKQLTETARKLKKAEAAQATYEKWLEALSGVADRVVKDQQATQDAKEALRKLEAQGDQGRDDLSLYVKETNAFLAEQAEAAKQEKAKAKKVQTPVDVAAREDNADQGKQQTPVTASNEAGESQSIFRPGIKFKLNP